MANKLNFSIAVKLVQEGFERGVNSVKSSLRSIQFQAMAMAGALGVGLNSLSGMMKNIIDTARETNRARIALKNVSDGAAGYRSNLKFMIDLSQKYGQNINVMTNAYQRFTAASTAAGVGMEDQRKIFEAMSRSITAFSLSSQEADLAFMAISQMMSKGKISSEELRRQLGERIPIAMAAMAEAAGVTIGELDELLRKGELMSADILPKFADALNRLTPNVDTDNLETSINRTRDAFIKLVTDLNIADWYKKFVQFGERAIAFVGVIANNIRTVVYTLLFAKIGSMFTKFNKGNQTLRDKALKEYQSAELQKAQATEKRIIAEQAMEEASMNGKKAQAKAQVALARAVANEQRQIAKLAEIDAKTSAIRTAGFWQLAGIRLKAIFASIGAAMRAAFSAIWITAVFTAIGWIVGKIAESVREANRIKKLYDEFKKEERNIGTNAQIVELEAIKRVLEDQKATIYDKNTATKKALDLLGIEKKSQEEITAEINKQIKALRDKAKADFYIQKEVEIENTIEEKKNALAKMLGRDSIDDKWVEDYKRAKNVDNLLERERKRDPVGQHLSGFTVSNTTELVRNLKQEDLRLLFQKKYSDEKRAFDELISLTKILGEVRKKTEEYIKKPENTSQDKNEEQTEQTEPANSSTPTKTDLQKAEESYTEKLRELNNQKALQLISDEEYREALNDLSKNTVKEIGGIMGMSAERNKTFIVAKKAMEETAKNESEFAKAVKDHADEEKRIVALKNNGISTEEEYERSMRSLIDNTLQRIGSMSDLTQAEREQLMQIKASRELYAKYTPKEYDTTFDYKKSQSDILAGQLDVLRDNISMATDVGAKELDELIAKEEDLERALKLTKIREDVQSLKEELNKGIYNGVKNIASTSRHVVSAFKQMSKVLSDVDASAIEKIASIFNAIIQTTDSILSTIKTINDLTNVLGKLASAKTAMQTADSVQTQQEVLNSAERSAAALTESGVKKSVAIANIASSKAEAAALAGKGAAAIPFPLNILAIGGAIAAAVAAFSAIPAFAGGGVVPSGSLFGDKIFARLNSGEVVLNASQQNRLFRLASGVDKPRYGGDVNINITGQSVLRGNDIVTIYNKTVRRNSR